MGDDVIPRCIHGNIVLGCPHDDCPTQSAHLDQQDAAIREWRRGQEQAARYVVRSLLDQRRSAHPTLRQETTESWRQAAEREQWPS